MIEKRPGPSQLSRAVGILPPSMEILRPSGVADRIDAEAVRFSDLRLHRGTRHFATLPLNFDDRSRLWGLAQDRTETHLREAFVRMGGEIRYGTGFEGLTHVDGGVEVQTSDGTRFYDRVIGADGVRSAVRAALGIPYAGYDLPGQWSIADVDSSDWRHPTSFQGFILPGDGVAIVVPLEAERFRVISSRPDALAALPVRMNVSNVRRSGSFTISVRQAQRYRMGQVYLAGDAAHCHSPAGGRGMNLGIADAADLAARIVSGQEDGYAALEVRAGFDQTGLRERLTDSVRAQNWPLKELKEAPYTLEETFIALAKSKEETGSKA